MEKIGWIWMALGYILDIEMTGFGNELAMGIELKKDKRRLLVWDFSN